MVPATTVSRFQMPTSHQIGGRQNSMPQLTKNHRRSELHVSYRSRHDTLTKVKVIRGVSILKPKLKDSNAKVDGYISLNKTCLTSKLLGTSKSHQLRRSSKGGVVSKEHVVKEVKNHQERIRRRDLAMQRENLRNMLPNSLELGKIGALQVLENAREYCLELQHKVALSEAQLRFEANWNKFLVRRLEGLLALPKPETPEEMMFVNTGVCIP